MKPSIIVHGGAWDIPDILIDGNTKGCESAAAAGFEVLRLGGSALDAVETAVSLLEDDSSFNAGRGSILNQAGEVEMDAIIMDGRTLSFGAVAALRHVRNPVRVARKIMEKTEFSMLAGEGALEFALSHGFKRVSNEDLLVGAQLDDYMEFKKTGRLRTRRHYAGEESDTVGACALDKDGHVASATSTGGTPRKLPGRVGDSPIVGCGAYADDELGAASATGWGEKIMSVVLSKSAIDLLRQGKDAEEACKISIGQLKTRVGGHGGLIIVSRDGRVGCFHNSPRMAFAYIEGPTGRSLAGIRL
jgi:beta-aspartyl-peptidase (threonine type)